MAARRRSGSSGAKAGSRDAYDLAEDLREGIERDAFPILRRRPRGRPLIYLDTAASAQMPESVIEAQAEYQRSHHANVHRGLHALAAEATAAYEGARARVADWLRAGTPQNVIFTRNATAGLNLVARGLEHRLEPGDEVLLTEMEHHANLVPWLVLAQRRKVRIRYLPLTPDGRLALDRLPELLGPRTRLVSFCWVSNVLGTINPVAEIVARAHEAGALAVVDAAQAVGHLEIDFQAAGADFLVFSAHKCYGPTGLGFLIGRPGPLSLLEPLETGGEMIEMVDWDRATWAELPHRLEAGTPNIAAAAAFPAVIDLLEQVGMARVRAHEEALVSRAWERLQEVGGLRLLGPADPRLRAGLVSFHDPEVHPHDQATLLDELGIAVRAGHHCAQPLHRRLGVVATARASFGLYSREEEIEALVEGIRHSRRVMAA
jgi:cysteine desulfurase/selenocysteine lyase